jgi:hypothetical protein
MTLYYSKLTKGFYNSEIHKNMPSDIVEITPELHQELLNGQSNGKIISTDLNGNPVVEEPTLVELEKNLTPEEQLQIDNKQSAINKLKALGLNDAEIKAITGI